MTTSEVQKAAEQIWCISSRLTEHVETVAWGLVKFC